jgi:hypothetical protein
LAEQKTSAASSPSSRQASSESELPLDHQMREPL